MNALTFHKNFQDEHLQTHFRDIYNKQATIIRNTLQSYHTCLSVRPVLHVRWLIVYSVLRRISFKLVLYLLEWLFEAVASSGDAFAKKIIIFF